VRLPTKEADVSTSNQHADAPNVHPYNAGSAFFDFRYRGGSNAVATATPHDLPMLRRAGFATPSFLVGTRIATRNGAIPVERIEPGMAVRSLNGTYVVVKWIGRREIYCARHPTPHDVWPVRVKRGAFADGVPQADLCLSPDHAVLIDGVRIPVVLLVNGRTIVQEPRNIVAYWHIELDGDDSIFAEGLVCETYPSKSRPVPHRDVARRLREGAELMAARSWLLARAVAQGNAQTDDPGLRAVVGGHVLLPRVIGRTHRFRLPEAARCVRLVSRSVVPAELREHSREARRLGVAVAHLRYGSVPIGLTDWRLGGGWHARERGPGGAWRWTDGNAGIVLRGGEVLEVEVTMTERYWCADYLAAPTQTVRSAA
jgi:hypothetical protein